MNKLLKIKTWSFLTVLFFVMVVSVVGPGQAVGNNCTTRPLSDFLNAQGSSSQFFPPVKDYVGWTDGNFTTFALVDYAGIANKYIKEQTGHSLGTKMSGSVTECALRNGKAQVTVYLFTTKALGFAQSIEDIIKYGFLDAPTIFGAKAQDVVLNGAKATVGPVSLITSFTIQRPGAPLPDFLAVVNSPTHYAPANLDFRSTTYGCSNDKKAQLDVYEVAQTIGNKWVYTVEEVAIGIDGDDCGD